MENREYWVQEAKKRIPLFRSLWESRLRAVLDHPEAPAWNIACGDRLDSDSLAFVKAYEAQIRSGKGDPNGSEGSDKIGPFWDQKAGLPGPRALSWMRKLYGDSADFRQRIGKLNPWFQAQDFWKIPTMGRSDLQRRLEQIVPLSADLEGLVVNPTSGTTGEPIPCPNHPRAVGCYEPLLFYALEQNGVLLKPDHQVMAALQICCQKQTIVYGTVHAFSQGAGFAKVNIHPQVWAPQSARAYLQDLAPQILTGDPYAFSVYMELNLGYRPLAVVSTAMELDEPLRQKMETYFQCPVVNYLSLNETGPLAHSLPGDRGALLVFPPDIMVEALDAKGYPVGPGELGEITVTGGRNPYLPLLRYRTGDWGILEPGGLIRGLQGRKPVVYYTQKGERINPVDVARILRFHPVMAYQLVQDPDGCLTLKLQAPSLLLRQKEALGQEISALFGGFSLTLEPNFLPESGKYLPHVGHMK